MHTHMHTQTDSTIETADMPSTHSQSSCATLTTASTAVDTTEYSAWQHWEAQHKRTSPQRNLLDDDDIDPVVERHMQVDSSSPSTSLAAYDKFPPHAPAFMLLAGLRFDFTNLLQDRVDEQTERHMQLQRQFSI